MKGLRCIGLATLITLMFGASEALAAERVLLRYRSFGRAVPVADLATLAETGEAPDSLDGLLNTAGQDPQGLSSVLTREVPADTIILDKALNSLPGEWLLDQLAEAIHPASGQGSRQALRSALVLSAADDDTITLLEVLENYPTPEVVLEGDLIHEAYNQLANFLEPLMILILGPGFFRLG
jgi:hypothetical protein